MLIDFIFILYINLLHLHSVNNILQVIQFDQHECYLLVSPELIKLFLHKSLSIVVSVNVRQISSFTFL